MAQTVFRETGAYESLAKTIGAWIEREFDNYEPSGLLASVFTFKHDEGRTHNAQTKLGTQTIAFNNGDTISDLDRKDSSNQIIGNTQEVFIDIYARSITQAEQAVTKINNIITALYPNQIRVINKANDTDISRITRFEEESGVEFVPEPIPDAMNNPTVSLSGVLTCLWQVNNA